MTRRCLFNQANLDEALSRVLEPALEKKLPDALRNAMRAAWLSGNQVTAEYGLTSRQLTYIREKRRIEFTQHGRRILYKRTSIESWISEGSVTPRIPVPSRAGVAA